MFLNLLNRLGLFLKAVGRFLQWLRMTNDLVGRERRLVPLLAGLLFTLCGLFQGGSANPVLILIFRPMQAGP